jgi:hypothetical protein
MPYLAIDANAEAVPLTRNGRSHCSTNAGVNDGLSGPQAVASPRRKSHSQSVAIR